jgi:hypothetical protein
MSESLIRKITEMKKSEWVAYNWINVTEQGSFEPVYLRSNLRPIENAISAAKEYDNWVKEVHTEYKKNRVISHGELAPLEKMP